MKDSTSGISGLPSLALVLSLEAEADDDGGAIPLEERVAALREGQLRGHSFAVYTGGEGAGRTVYLVVPLQSGDEAGPGFELPCDELTRETLEPSDESLKSGGGFIAEYIPELSNPAGEGRLETAPYVYLISAVMKQGLAEDFRNSAWEAGRKIAAAHRQDRGGSHFAVYRSYRGMNEVFYVAVPLDGLEGVEDRLDYRRPLREAYGADEAARLTYVVGEAITTNVSGVGKRHPSC